MVLKDESAPPCPYCHSDNTYYGEYGIACNNDGPVHDDCPIVFFREQ